jgi:hypothetical protein
MNADRLKELERREQIMLEARRQGKLHGWAHDEEVAHVRKLIGNAKTTTSD